MIQSPKDIRSWPKIHGLLELEAVTDRSFVVDPFLHFGSDEWKADRTTILEKICQSGLGSAVTVRSAGYQEDNPAEIPPGFFKSILDVATADAEALTVAIEAVCRSYDRPERPGSPRLPDRIIVQRHVGNCVVAGIAFLEHPSQPYALVEYDDQSGRTDGVTAGEAVKRADLYLGEVRVEPVWSQVAQALAEISRGQRTALLVEFCVDERHAVHVFQIRSDNRERPSRGPPRPTFTGTHQALDGRLRQMRDAVSNTGPVARMSDWNPAEILGPQPSRFSVSLYEEIVTDRAWAEGRAAAGWSLPADTKLLCTVGGTPYVKVATSFASLVPSTLPRALTDRLVKDRLEYLRDNRSLHDKVEFRVMWSAHDFGFDGSLDHLKSRGFSADEVSELRSALLSVTKGAIANFDRWSSEDFGAQESIARHRILLAQQLEGSPSFRGAFASVRQALKVCSVAGARPFSRQARLAFMFRYMLACLLRGGALEEAWVTQFLGGIETVAGSLVKQLARVRGDRLLRPKFNEEFGHLRPNTYDMLSPRYDEIVDLPGLAHDRPCAPSPNVALEVPSSLGRALSASGLSVSGEAFVALARRAIQARESIKFSFSSLLSDALKALSEQASRAGVSPAELSGLPLSAVEDIVTTSASDANAVARLRSAFQDGVVQRQHDLLLRMPDIAFMPDELVLVPKLDNVPTFIGAGRISAAPVNLLDGVTAGPGDLVGKILVVRSLDPGSDWIFAADIAGLVTAFGGEFSHMAVRCSEFGIPAALGCGLETCSMLANAGLVTIDASACVLSGDGRALLRGA